MRVLFGQSSVLLYDSMYRVCCVYINVVVVFSSDLGIFEYFNIRILGRYIRTNSKTMLAALGLGDLLSLTSMRSGGIHRM